MTDAIDARGDEEVASIPNGCLLAVECLATVNV